jgi:hypothetical protein
MRRRETADGVRAAPKEGPRSCSTAFPASTSGALSFSRISRAEPRDQGAQATYPPRGLSAAPWWIPTLPLVVAGRLPPLRSPAASKRIDASRTSGKPEGCIVTLPSADQTTRIADAAGGTVRPRRPIHRARTPANTSGMPALPRVDQKACSARTRAGSRAQDVVARPEGAGQERRNLRPGILAKGHQVQQADHDEADGRHPLHGPVSHLVCESIRQHAATGRCSTSRVVNARCPDLEPSAPVHDHPDLSSQMFEVARPAEG